MKIDEAKTAYNAHASEQMHRFLQSKTWEEKVRSIERMRAASRKAREAMRLRNEESLSERREQTLASGSESAVATGASDPCSTKL